MPAALNVQASDFDSQVQNHPKKPKIHWGLGRLMLSSYMNLRSTNTPLLNHVYNYNLNLNNNLDFMQGYMLKKIQVSVFNFVASQKACKSHKSSTPWKSVVHILMNTNPILDLLESYKRQITQVNHGKMYFSSISRFL